MNKYGPKAREEIDRTMKRFKDGQLKIGSTGQTVTDPKQAVAISINEARKKHIKAPGQH